MSIFTPADLADLQDKDALDKVKASTLERACAEAARACHEQYKRMALENIVGAGEYWSQRAEFQLSEYDYHTAKAETLEAKGL